MTGHRYEITGRPQKASDQQFNLLDLTPRRSAILMPSYEGRDVRLLGAEGILTPTTRQWWVESEAHVLPHLHALAAELQFKQVFPVHTALEDFDPPEPLDYINADMMSAFVEPLALWFENKAGPKLMFGSTIVVTLTKGYRRNSFLDWLEQECYDGELKPLVDRFKIMLREFDPDLVLPRVALSCALSRFQFDWFPGTIYQDTKVAMTSMRIDNIRPRSGPSPWPLISELSNKFRAQHIAASYGERVPSGMLDIRERLRPFGMTVVGASNNRWEVQVLATGMPIQIYKSLPEIVSTFGL